MSTLAEIQQAADTLSPEQKQELILFLATPLRADGAQMPVPRKFTMKEMMGWIAEDDADMERFRRTHESYVAYRANHASRESSDEALAEVPDAPPKPGDEWLA